MIHFLNGDTLHPFDHPYNTTALNERAVELRMALNFLDDCFCRAGIGRMLEVGNVLNHYGEDTERRVVDRFEVAPGVENIDVFDIEGTYDTIVSISTIEHVGVDDGTDGANDAFFAIDHLRSLLAPGGRFFCTFPTGWNERLDIALRAGSISRLSVSGTFFVRDGTNWIEASGNRFGGYDPFPYGVTQPWAEAVWVGEFGPL